MKVLFLLLIIIEILFARVSAIYHQFPSVLPNGDQVANEFQLINTAEPYTLLNHDQNKHVSILSSVQERNIIHSDSGSTGNIST
jgi:hypothetical protein